jgi:hypothetical protein
MASGDIYIYLMLVGSSQVPKGEIGDFNILKNFYMFISLKII